MTKERNQFVDIIRGVAMLLVVLGHTMTGSTVNSQSSFLFNIVWSLQMPLFILISGYVTRYSKEIRTISELFKFFLKRTTAYLLPFAVWSFLIRGIILNQKVFLDIKYMLWHIDSGYWFLITIWTISMIFGIANFASSKIKKSVLGKQILLFVVYACGMALLGTIGYFAGISFLGIKLTLYYMPFYFVGYLYGQYRDKIFSFSFGKTTVDIIVAICLAVWIFALIRFNIYELSDGGKDIILRAAVSLSGCIAVCGLLKGILSEKSRGVSVRSQMDGCPLARNIPCPLPIPKSDKDGELTDSYLDKGSSVCGNELCCYLDNNGDDNKAYKLEQSYKILSLR
ncbi:MAG: acyltransferase, partial [Clostridia bacterium]|nr:acyltransferase [Clostridia bacterium]